MKGVRFSAGNIGKALLCMSLPFFLFFAACSDHPAYPEPVMTASAVEFDIKTLKPDSPRFFTYRLQDKNINYFIVKINGKVLAFFDACAKCYTSKLGYGFSNGYFVCKACSMRYSVSDIENGIGSCFPIRIKGAIRDGRYVIHHQSLEKAAHMF